MLEFDVVFWLFYVAGTCFSYKLGAALIYTLFILAVQKCIFSHNNDAPALLSRIVDAGCL
jgi:hypothetical protein